MALAAASAVRWLIELEVSWLVKERWNIDGLLALKVQSHLEIRSLSFFLDSSIITRQPLSFSTLGSRRKTCAMAASWIASFLYAQFFKRPPYPTKSFAGQTIIVTGSNTGLGLEAAKHFVRLSASHVILAVRNASKGEAAKASILASLPNASSTISVWSLDLTSFESVKAFAEQVKGLERLDAVVENAGMATAVWKEIEGYESTVLTNVISTELLTLLVLPKLRESGLRFNTVPRLSIVTSDMHFVAGFEEGKADDVFAALNDKEGKGFGER